jgi:hypothetical protein
MSNRLVEVSKPHNYVIPSLLLLQVQVSKGANVLKEKIRVMAKFKTPEDLLNSQVLEFNKGNTDFLMTLYEKDACLASQPGQVVKDQERIRRAFQEIINTGGKLKARAKRILYASNLALLITEWSITGTEHDGISNLSVI